MGDTEPFLLPFFVLRPSKGLWEGEVEVAKHINTSGGAAAAQGRRHWIGTLGRRQLRIPPFPPPHTHLLLGTSGYNPGCADPIEGLGAREEIAQLLTSPHRALNGPLTPWSWLHVDKKNSILRACAAVEIRQYSFCSRSGPVSLPLLSASSCFRNCHPLGLYMNPSFLTKCFFQTV